MSAGNAGLTKRGGNRLSPGEIHEGAAWVHRIRNQWSRTHSTHTTVLGLPRKEVEQRSKWLPDETKANPEDAIPNGFTQRISHLLEGCSESDEWQLEHHAKEGNPCNRSETFPMKSEGRGIERTDEIVGRNSHQHFV